MLSQCLGAHSASAVLSLACSLLTSAVPLGRWERKGMTLNDRSGWARSKQHPLYSWTGASPRCCIESVGYNLHELLVAQKGIIQDGVSGNHCGFGNLIVSARRLGFRVLAVEKVTELGWRHETEHKVERQQWHQRFTHSWAQKLGFVVMD